LAAGGTGENRDLTATTQVNGATIAFGPDLPATRLARCPCHPTTAAYRRAPTATLRSPTPSSPGPLCWAGDDTTAAAATGRD
jgi:hypothetical protein